jgi:choline dehydrogenase-like flavoprotein
LTGGYFALCGGVMNIGSTSQPTDFTIDVFGRYVCNTFDEALANSDPGFRATATDINGNPLPARGDMRPFDFIVIGGGTFGVAVAEHLLFRSTGRSERILVLEAGPFLVSEHVQNLPSLTIGGEVWGQSWNGNVGFPGLAFCLGGRSAFWGGWSPRLLDSETAGRWPAAVLGDLNAQTLPNRDLGYFRQSGQQIGVTETNDYIFGELHTALRDVLFDAVNGGSITAAVPLASLPDAPMVELLAPTAPTDAQLAEFLGIPLPNPVPAGFRAEALNKLKLEAPLAVQARSGHAGFFPLNKFSTIPLLIKAARTAYAEAPGDDVRKRLMVVPRCHVQRLNVVNDAGGRRVDAVVTERGPVPVTPGSKVIIALGTIESTRLALLSFGEDGRLGTNLMAHLRSNIDFRVPRTAFTKLPPGLKALQTSALLMKGRHQFKKPDGSSDGVGHFHFQITASGLDQVNTNSEAELFQKIPDIDSVNQHLFASDSHVVITIRGIGEMEPGNPNSNVTLDRNPMQVDYNERKAFVNLNASARDMELWKVMDTASDQLAAIFANGQKIDILVRNKGIIKASNVDAAKYGTVLPHQVLDPATGQMVNNPERRDGLGTTHHEAGTLRMGDNPATSVTDVNCRFHGVSNVYAAGPALFPSNGSPNPMLTGIALARRLGDHLLPPPPMPKSGVTYLFDGTQKSADFFKDWLMVGGGSFRIVGRSLIAQPGNQIGLLFYAAKQFDDFTLSLDFCLPHPRGNSNDNSGIFVRFRDPRKPVLPGTPGPDVPGNAATVAVDTGYEIQIDEEARGDTRKKEPDGRPEQDGHFFNRTGAIYKLKAQGTAPGQQSYTNNQQLAPGVWHSYEIKVTGRTYEVKLNGQPATSFTADPADPAEKFRGRKKTEDPDSGFIGVQVHTGAVAFANIRVS